MTYRIAVATLLASAAFAQPDSKQPDPKQLVKQSVENYDRDWRESLGWCYRQTDVTHKDDHDERTVSEIAPVAGLPFERLVMKDGQPLSPEVREKEDRKFQKAAELRRKETPEKHDERMAKYEKERMFVQRIPDAFDFTLVGEEDVNGRPAWEITFKPRADFIPTMPHGELMKHIAGKLWIDEQDLQWAKAEATVIDTISFDVFLARIGPGTHFEVEQTRVADNFWMPKRIHISGTAKVLLVDNKMLDEEFLYSGYHRDGPHAQTPQQ